MDWNELKQRVAGCVKCPIRHGCKAPVFGEGPENARIMLIGEAPGENEDKTGRPFVGLAGQALDKMLGRAGLKRGEVYVANVLKCRPPDNRTPTKEEIGNCFMYLREQIAHMKPTVIVALGAEATAVLLSPTGKKVTMGDVRGRVQSTWAGKVIPTWHPFAAGVEP